MCVYSHLPAYEDRTDSVPKRRHIKSRRRVITQKKAYNSQLMLFGEIITVSSEIRSIENTLSAACVQNTEILNVKPGGTRGYKVLISGTAMMF